MVLGVAKKGAMHVGTAVGGSREQWGGSEA